MSYVIDVWVPTTLATYDVQVVATGTTGPRGAQGPAGTGIEALTTKGDLLGYSTSGARVPVGTNNHVLTADSTQALGVKWAAPDVTQAEPDAHAAVTSSVHGISAFGATLVDDADAATARTTLGLGSAATSASTAFVASTLPDAKGDLFTATAADTPARLAVGTNGHVLTADSAEATGLKWAAASGGGGFTVYETNLLATSEIDTATWGIPGVGTTASTNATTLGSQPGGRMLMAPFLVSSAITLTDVGIRVATAASAGNRCRLAIYAYGTKTPVGGALVSDIGTVLVDSTGYKTIGSLSVSLAAGQYVAAVLFEASTTLYTQRAPAWWLTTQYLYPLDTNDIDMWYKAQSFGAAPSTLSSTFGGGANSNGGFCFPMMMKWSQA